MAPDILAQLDGDQRAAAEFVQGPLLIFAGPGSGKTRTLTHRIAHLVADCGVPPGACLAITFTRRAAAEMKERLTTLLPNVWEQIPVHTFHSLGLSILKENTNAAGLGRGFRIADERASAAILKESLEVSDRKARALLRAISKTKRTQGAADAELKNAMDRYQQAIEHRNWVDFDDLVGLALQTLTADSGLTARYRDRFPWISIDEFQDLDEQQYLLMKQLAPPEAHLCVIGDANQAIYGFRGADASCFHRFQEDYPDAALVHLTSNYRSSGTIATASAQVIASSPEEADMAQAVREMHERITIHNARTERAEAEFVVHTIEQMIGGHSFFSIDSGRVGEESQDDLSFSDFAVLYRTDAQSGALCEAISRSGMPFQKHAHMRLTDQTGVQMLIERLESLPESGTDERSLRVQLEDAAESLMNEAKPDEAREIEAGLQQLSALAEACGDDRERFFEALPLATEADGWDPRADRVSLLTLHAAKGLEFPVVFIVGLEDGILPLHWGKADDAAQEEERRLFYVGMTRAMDQLFLSRAVKRRWNGRVQNLDPSPYLKDIENELLKHSRMKARRKREADKQLGLF